MKNIPDKIYLNLNMTPQEVVETKDKDFHEATKTWEITWSEERLSGHDPEYVSKDAFIEKACDTYCRLCDTKECGDNGECIWVEKFRKHLMK